MPINNKQLEKTLSQVVNTKIPQVIFGKNEPIAVILDYASYNIFLALFDDLEDRGRYLDAQREASGARGISLSALKKKYHLK